MATETFDGYTAAELRAMSMADLQAFYGSLSESRRIDLFKFLYDNPVPPPLADLPQAAAEALGLPPLGDVGRLLLVVVGTGALATLGVVLVVAGVMNVLGFRAGDVARLTPPGRASATIGEVAVSSRGKAG